jgi:hypothetical protein
MRERWHDHVKDQQVESEDEKQWMLEAEKMKDVCKAKV